jgi:Family of unknown function (DUF6941)
MASLDFVLLAEYARVDQAGLITIVGGGFDRVRVPAQGGMQQVFVAMRIVLDEREPDVPFEVKAQSPDNHYQIGVAGTTRRVPDVQPSDGKINFIAAIGLVVPIQMAGRYLVQIVLAGEVVRSLPFAVEFAPPEGS